VCGTRVNPSGAQERGGIGTNRGRGRSGTHRRMTKGGQRERSASMEL